MSLKNIIASITIFTCSLSLVKAGDQPVEYPRPGEGTNKNHITVPETKKRPSQCFFETFLLTLPSCNKKAEYLNKKAGYFNKKQYGHRY